ncbi:hypothetical protein ACFQYP_22255 [Nonomuraea antimicrobica]
MTADKNLGGAWGVTVTGGAIFGLISWRAVATLLAIMALSGAFRIIIERQRRRTFVALVTDAPRAPWSYSRMAPEAR